MTNIALTALVIQLLALITWLVCYAVLVPVFATWLVSLQFCSAPLFLGHNRKRCELHTLRHASVYRWVGSDCLTYVQRFVVTSCLSTRCPALIP